jgi:uncharacterized membrane protein
VKLRSLSTPEGASAWSAGLIGVGLMAAADEIVFHQLLAWHHFYDRSTPLVGLISDGVLHAAEIFFLVIGFFLILRLHRSNRLMTSWSWAGGVLGAGFFQVFDGIVDHKLLRIHQVRYGVDNLWLYDVLWNGVGVVLIGIGFALLVKLWPGRSSKATRD